MLTNTNSYLLLTPGPLSTSQSVREAMLRDWCTWDDDYNLGIIEPIRKELLKIASKTPDDYTVALMQGSGTFAVESAIGNFIPKKGKLLVLVNGAYGARIAKIAKCLNIKHSVLENAETEQTDVNELQERLFEDNTITHVALVHNETTTGMLNPLAEVAKCVKAAGKTLIVDAMSSFGGIPMDIAELDIDVLISSANKCIQGVPGFGFVIAKTDLMKSSKGNARSLSLDLYDQWEAMEKGSGKWRFTSPTHVVRAFFQALQELEEEGGVNARHARYSENHRILTEGMKSLGFSALLPESMQSPIITSFINPHSPHYNFKYFYNALKQQGFVIYPGKVSGADTFRIGTIGHVFPEDFKRLIQAIAKIKLW